AEEGPVLGVEARRRPRDVDEAEHAAGADQGRADAVAPAVGDEDALAADEERVEDRAGQDQLAPVRDAAQPAAVAQPDDADLAAEPIDGARDQPRRDLPGRLD